jgi:hypothetical protein
MHHALCTQLQGEENHLLSNEVSGMSRFIAILL